MSATLLCSGCYAPLLGADSSPILVSPCQNIDCPFSVRIPEIDALMKDIDIGMLLDPALFSGSAYLSPPDCMYPEVVIPRSPHLASDSASISGSVIESETSQSVAWPLEIEPAPLPSAVSHEQLPFVKLRGSSIHIKRPANSFMLYRSDKIKSWKATNPRAKTTGVFTSMIGQLWKQEKASVKDQYAQRARDLADIHTKTFPDYKFAPRRNVIQR